MRRLAPEYRALTGFDLVPGTLNVELQEPWRSPADALELPADPARGTVRVLVTPCRVGDLDAFVLRTEANEEGRGDHPTTLVEVAAAVHLRSALGLEDGDEVTLVIPREADD